MFVVLFSIGENAAATHSSFKMTKREELITCQRMSYTTAFPRIVYTFKCIFGAIRHITCRYAVKPSKANKQNVKNYHRNTRIRLRAINL